MAALAAVSVTWVIAPVHCHDVSRLGTVGEALLVDHASIRVGDGERPQLTTLLSEGVTEGTEGERERLGDKSEDMRDDGQEPHCDDDGDSGKGHHRVIIRAAEGSCRRLVTSASAQRHLELSGHRSMQAR